MRQITKPSAVAGITVEGFAKRTNNFHAQPNTSARSQAMEFSDADLKPCIVCGDPVSDSFAPSSDGRCDTCCGYRRPPRPFRRRSAAARCAAADCIRPPQRNRITRRVHAAA